MSLTSNIPQVNIKEELSSLKTRPGIKGKQVYELDTAEEVRDLIGARGRKNLIINGGFDVWQRGTANTAISGIAHYTADRWCSNASAATLSVEAGRDTANLPYNRLRIIQTATPTIHNMLQQRVEGLNELSGKTMTFSIEAKVGSGTKDFALVAYISIAAGGSSTILSKIVTFTSEYARFEFTFDVPDMSSSTINNATDFLQVYVQDASDFKPYTADFKEAQLELAPFATEFEHRSYGEELALCQRYYWRGGLQDSGASLFYGVTAMAGHAGGTSFPTRMRVIPTVTTITAPTYTNATANALLASVDGFVDRVTVTANGAFRSLLGVYSADAEL